MNVIIREKINRLYNRFMQKNANWLFRGVLETDPIPTNPDSETILYCALDRSSCRQYITAVKSLLRYDNNFAVVAQSDGSLDSQCVREIVDHLPGIIVLSKDDMLQCIQDQAGPELQKLIPSAEEYSLYTPVKIMYLKFLNVIFQFNGRKVIIIDSDLLFLRKPEFILDWAKAPYTHDFYSEGSNARAAVFHAMGFKFTYLDVANFSSGTIGVGGEVSKQELIDIFSRIREYDASLFYAWEIEQALWSIVMATRENPINIDDLREVYVGSGWRSYEELKAKAVIAHFAGAVRFNSFKYLRCAKGVFLDLSFRQPDVKP
ncbi:MAG: hypothetical protein HXX11_14520 [Desulfuromonadales bacterium]|nr:hypothetical protein [Desulfuromonadales bacterium]